jgi:hypothetical protein
MKRWRPRARGRAARIRKPTCHITVKLTTVERAPEPAPKAEPKAEEPKGEEPKQKPAPRKKAPAKKKTEEAKA